VPLKFKNEFNFLIGMVGVGVSPTPTTNELKTSWICEAALYKLVFKSKTKHAEVFQDWVCSEVPPSLFERPVADNREDRLQYDLVKHIKARYPGFALQAGLGEHLTTLHAIINATSKGYIQGNPIS
jgi:hypothetical protein